MDPLTSNLATRAPIAPNVQTGNQGATTGSGKFSQIKQELSDNASNQAANPTAEAERLQQAKNVNPADAAAPTSPAGKIQQSLATGQQTLTRLKARIDASPNASNLQGLMKRITGFEDQYRQLDSAMRALPSDASPQQWLTLQQRVYNLGENVGTLSNIVNQATSSIKSLLQTQI